MGLALRIVVGTALLIASIAAAALLVCSGVLVSRLWSGGHGRLDDGTIVIAYISAASSLLHGTPKGAATLIRLAKYRPPTMVRWSRILNTSRPKYSNGD